MPDAIDPRYPIGKVEDQLFGSKGDYDEKVKAALLLDIQQCPGLLEQAISNLDEHQLNIPYRDDGWTSRQVIHHVADSHMNAYVRFKLTLTEDTPPLKPYEEQIWAELIDGKTGDPATSLGILDGVHHRLHRLLTSLAPS